MILIPAAVYVAFLFQMGPSISTIHPLLGSLAFRQHILHFFVTTYQNCIFINLFKVFVSLVSIILITTHEKDMNFLVHLLFVDHEKSSTIVLKCISVVQARHLISNCWCIIKKNSIFYISILIHYFLYHSYEEFMRRQTWSSQSFRSD